MKARPEQLEATQNPVPPPPPVRRRKVAGTDAHTEPAIRLSLVLCSIVASEVTLNHHWRGRSSSQPKLRLARASTPGWGVDRRPRC